MNGLTIVDTDILIDAAHQISEAVVVQLLIAFA